MLNAQEHLSSHLQLVLKQIRLLPETLPGLRQPGIALLLQEIKPQSIRAIACPAQQPLLISDSYHFIINLSVHFQCNLQYTQDSFSLI